MNEIWIPTIVSAVGALAVVVVQWQLNERSNSAIEKLRANLTVITDQRRSLFERRADILADVYGKLVASKEAFDDFLNSGIRWADSPGPEERHRAAVLAGEEFRLAFTRSRILLPRYLLEDLDAINREFIAVSREFTGQLAVGTDENRALIAVYQSKSETIGTTLSKIEGAFRDAIDGKE